MNEMASARVRFGFWRIFILFRREGWEENHKVVYRLYKEEALNLRIKRPIRNRSAATRLERPILSGSNQLWSMDFVSDAVFDGKKLIALTLVDNHTRESLAIMDGQSLKGTCIAQALSDAIASGRELPQRIQTDNGPQFITVALDRWAYDNKIILDFS